MVTRERKWLSVKTIKTILDEKHTSPEEKIEKLENNVQSVRQIQPKLNPPDGWISISKANREYPNLPRTTIEDWTQERPNTLPLIPSIRIGKERCIEKHIIAYIAKRYKKGKGRGNRQIKQILRDMTNT